MAYRYVEEHSKGFGMEWSQANVEIRDMAVDEISEILGFVSERYGKQEDTWVHRHCVNLRRRCCSFTDQFWKDHLLAMDRLRHGVSLRGRKRNHFLSTSVKVLKCSC